MQTKRASRERASEGPRNGETSLTRPNRRACSQATDESKNLSEESFEQHKELTYFEQNSNVSTPVEELRWRFKNEIGSIRKKAEQALVEALVKYHHRRPERLTDKLRKLEQYKSRRNTVRNNIGILSRRLTRKRSHRLEARPRKKTVNKDDNVAVSLLGTVTDFSLLTLHFGAAAGGQASRVIVTCNIKTCRVVAFG